MTLAVVIPICRIQEFPARVAALRHVLGRVRARLMPDRLVLAEQLEPDAEPWRDCDAMVDAHCLVRLEGDWSRSAMFNGGVRAAACDVVLLLDGDTCLDWEAVRARAATLPEGTVCQPYSEARRLPAELTRQAIETGRVAVPPGLETTSMLGSIAVLIRTADYWRVGGFDERYSGWGVEDNAFGRMCRGLLDVVRIERPAYHLDHGRDKPSLMQTEAYARNLELYRHTVFPTRPAPGLALVACSWGDGPAHLAATRRAVATWWTCSPRPSLCVLVADRASREAGAFEVPEWQTVETIELEIPPHGRALFQKHAFWEAARRAILARPEIDRAVFLDSHLSLDGCPDFFHRVDLSLAKYEVVQPFESVRDDGDGTLRNGCVCQWATGRTRHGTPGFAFAARADFLRRMGPFPAVPVNAEDVALWNRMLPGKLGAPWIESGPAWKRDAQFRAIVPRPSAGYLKGVSLAHCSHGPTADRRYAEQVALLTHAASQFSDLVGEPCPGVAYGPRDTPEAMAFAAAMARIGEVRGARETRDLWDSELRARMPRIDEGHPLAVACVLRSGAAYGPEHVVWLRAQVAAHVLAPHRFVCLADCDVPGVETVRMVHGLPVTRSKLELFRPELFPDPRESVLFLDLDTVVTRDFELPVCPEGRIHYIRERDRRPAWPAWGSGVMYFRGGGRYARILERFIEDREAGRSPEWQFPGEQEFSSYCVYFERLGAACDIERLLAVRLYDSQSRRDAPPPEAHLVTWVTRAKPWDCDLPWVPRLGSQAACDLQARCRSSAK